MRGWLLVYVVITVCTIQNYDYECMKGEFISLSDIPWTELNRYGVEVKEEHLQDVNEQQ